MKKNLFVPVLFVVIVCAAFLSTGCVTQPPATAFGDVFFENYGHFENVRIPAKDFQPVGLVFTEVTLTINERAGNRRTEGYVLTYQALLREAHSLGAHAIINVTIDRVTRINNETEYDWRRTTVTEHTWFGSALAIRYTDAIILPAAGQEAVGARGSIR